MPLTFPVSLPAGVAAPSAWPHYCTADGFYYVYPHWLGLEHVRTVAGGIVAALERSGGAGGVPATN